MLPMILGFLGSAFAPAIAGATGIAALASPLLAGAVGAGLGSFAQTGSLKEGLKTGLGSFVGGKLLGGLMGSTAMGGAAGAAPGINAPAAGVPGMGGVAGLPMKAQLANVGSAAAPMNAAVGQGALARGMAFAQSPTGIGSLLGQALTAPRPTVGTFGNKAEEVVDVPEMRPIPRPVVMPPEGYRPGIDPEFDYGVSTPFSYDQLTNYNRSGILPYAEGGEVTKPNEKTEIVEAVAAIKGQHPQPEMALGKFLAKYGEDALRNLVDSVQSGEFDETLDRFKRGENGVVRGPGDGTGVDDKVPATIDGEQDVLLSDGEFVLRKDATDALEKKFGGGFLSAVNDAGKRAPDALKKRVAA